MVNKKGFMRIIESTIAVMIVLGTIVLLSSQRVAVKSVDLGAELPSLLDETARNTTLREEIARNSDESQIEEGLELSLGDRLNNPGINVSVELCNLTEPCFLSPYPDTDEEIFSAERIVSGNVKEIGFDPRKIKVFIWRSG
jgi:hypothetical protein